MANEDLYVDFNDSRCGVLDEHFDRVLSMMQFWCEGVLFMTFGIVGLVANIVSVSILAKKKLRQHIFNQLLIALAFFDMLFIVVSVPVYSFSLFGILEGNKMFSLLYVNFLYPMSPVALCASIYMTLSIATERYLAVCKPHFYRNLNRTMSSTRRVFMYVTPVAFLSLILNIPKFLEIKATDDDDNVTHIDIADLRMDPTYIHYYTLSQIFHPTLTTGLLPMGLLIFANWSIFKGIRKSKMALNQRRPPNQPLATSATTPLTTAALNCNQNNGQNIVGRVQQQQQQRNQQQQKSEKNLAVVLISIVIMHIMCHSLRVFLAGVAVHLIKDTMYCMRKHNGYVPPLWTLCLECISSLLIMINFSGNFLIYCSVLRPFKKALSGLCSLLKLQHWTRCFLPSNDQDNDDGIEDNELEQANENGDNEGIELADEEVRETCVLNEDTNQITVEAEVNNHATNAAPVPCGSSGGQGFDHGKQRLLACKRERERVALIAHELGEELTESNHQ